MISVFSFATITIKFLFKKFKGALLNSMQYINTRSISKYGYAGVLKQHSMREEKQWR